MEQESCVMREGDDQNLREEDPQEEALYQQWLACLLRNMSKRRQALCDLARVNLERLEAPAHRTETFVLLFDRMATLLQESSHPHTAKLLQEYGQEHCSLLSRFYHRVAGEVQSGAIKP